MKLSHRRKRDHKAKVRRHAWKAKRVARVRRMCKEFDEGIAHNHYRTLAIATGEMHARNTHQRFMVRMASKFDRRSRTYRKACTAAFLYGYDSVMNDRRYDKQFKAATLDRVSARALDYLNWDRGFFNDPVPVPNGVIKLKPGERMELIISPEPMVYCGSARTGKTRLWDRAKAKVASWFGGSSLKKQSL